MTLPISREYLRLEKEVEILVRRRQVARLLQFTSTSAQMTCRLSA